LKGNPEAMRRWLQRSTLILAGGVTASVKQKTGPIVLEFNGIEVPE